MNRFRCVFDAEKRVHIERKRSELIPKWTVVFHEVSQAKKLQLEFIFRQIADVEHRIEGGRLHPFHHPFHVLSVIDDLMVDPNAPIESI